MNRTTRRSARLNKLKTSNDTELDDQKENVNIEENSLKEQTLDKTKDENTNKTENSELGKSEFCQSESLLPICSREITSEKLPQSFYDSPCEDLAKNMLGKILVRKLEDGTILKGKIVETIAYTSLRKQNYSDEFSDYPKHGITCNFSMYGTSGIIYVHFFWRQLRFNIFSKDGNFVFLRALEPLEGIERMKENRNLQNSKAVKRKKGSKKLKKDLELHELCNGPAKLCSAFDIKPELSNYSMGTCTEMWLENNLKQENLKIEVEDDGRTNTNKRTRFYILDNPFVTIRYVDETENNSD